MSIRYLWKCLKQFSFLCLSFNQNPWHWGESFLFVLYVWDWALSSKYIGHALAQYWNWQLCTVYEMATILTRKRTHVDRRQCDSKLNEWKIVGEEILIYDVTRLIDVCAYYLHRKTKIWFSIGSEQNTWIRDRDSFGFMLPCNFSAYILNIHNLPPTNK